MSPFDLSRPSQGVRILMMLLFGMMAVCVEAAALGTASTTRFAPDLLLCALCCWTIRRPSSTPLLAVFVLGLVRDLLTDLPVGAGALSLVLVAEAMKAWHHHLARSTFAVEWLFVAGATLCTVAIQWFLVAIMLAQPPYLIDLGYRAFYTALAYPVVALVGGWLFRVGHKRKANA